jgi:formiminotetrahydrofolate cyclodeaminase
MSGGGTRNDERPLDTPEISKRRRPLRMLVQHPATGAEQEGGARNDFALRDLKVSALLTEFAAGNPVPGSGSANALAANLAACLAASVAIKTYKAPGATYRHIQQTAIDLERRAHRIGQELLDLLEEDSAAFSPVIAIRRDTGRAGDAVLQDSSLRQEVAALKPATIIPLRIAELAAEVADLALKMLAGGYAAAQGESYTALAQAIAAVDGAMFVAQLNIRTIRRRLQKLNDPELEADWIRLRLRDIEALRTRWRSLRLAEHRARRSLHKETFEVEQAKRAKPKRNRRQTLRTGPR